MKSIVARLKSLRALALMISVHLLGTTAMATVELSDDWSVTYLPNGGGKMLNDPNRAALENLRSVFDIAAANRSAELRRGDQSRKNYLEDPELKMRINGTLYYITPVGFMTKSRPDEVCTPKRNKNTPIYECDEGQRLTRDCHLLVFNERFEEVGYHRIEMNEPYQFFCNAVLAVGTGNKKLNELLVTTQHFPIDRKAASKISEIGSGWKRATYLLKVSANAGKVTFEQDDACLKNPNQIETVPDARQKLKQCAQTIQ